MPVMAGGAGVPGAAAVPMPVMTPAQAQMMAAHQAQIAAQAQLAAQNNVAAYDDALDDEDAIIEDTGHVMEEEDGEWTPDGVVPTETTGGAASKAGSRSEQHRPVIRPGIKSYKDDDIDALGRVKGEVDEAYLDVHEIQVPDRAQGGDVISFSSDGQHFCVVVPKGLQPGDKFQYQPKSHNKLGDRVQGSYQGIKLGYTRMAKDWGPPHGVVEGTITGWHTRDQLFRIAYDDGDVEQLEPGEVLPLLKGAEGAALQRYVTKKRMREAQIAAGADPSAKRARDAAPVAAVAAPMATAVPAAAAPAEQQQMRAAHQQLQAQAHALVQQQHLQRLVQQQQAAMNHRQPAAQVAAPAPAMMAAAQVAAPAPAAPAQVAAPAPAMAAAQVAAPAAVYAAHATMPGQY